MWHILDAFRAHCTTWITARQLHVDGDLGGVCGAVTIYFWWQNTKGIEESSEKALKVMKITTVMVVLLLALGRFIGCSCRAHLPPLPYAEQSALQHRTRLDF